MQPISKQRIGKHASTTIELLSETVSYIWSLQSVFKEENWDNQLVEGWQLS
jgi:hypothetical protein